MTRKRIKIRKTLFCLHSEAEIMFPGFYVMLQIILIKPVSVHETSGYLLLLEAIWNFMHSLCINQDVLKTPLLLAKKLNIVENKIHFKREK